MNETGRVGALSMSVAAEALRSGALSSRDLVSTALSDVAARDGTLGAFLATFAEQSLAAADRADVELSRGLDRGPLHGLPVGIKDILSTSDGPTTAQSLVLDRSWGEEMGDAAVVSRLREAGAVIIGKLTTCEFAIGVPDARMPFPVPRNPWDLDHWAGGSSSGAGSAVATGMVFGAIGTDTGGSIRMPAAYCGVTGIKPTFGLVPKSGTVPLGFSLDHIGPLARSARDAAYLLEAVAGADPGDPASSRRPPPSLVPGLSGDIAGLRVGFNQLTEFADGGEDPDLTDVYQSALEVLADAGAVLVPVRLPYYDTLTALTFVLFATEAVAYHLPDFRSRWNDFTVGTRARLSAGMLVSGADYVQAQRVRRVAQLALNDVFSAVDVIVTPTASLTAIRLTEVDSGLKSLHTPYWDAVGNPAVSVPMGHGRNGLPLGLQICVRPFADATALQVADAFQLRTDWHTREPPFRGASRTRT